MARRRVSPLIIVPARVGSSRIPRKNFRRAPDGTTLIDRAVADAKKLGGEIVVTTDHRTWTAPGVAVIRRAKALAADDTPMADTVEDVLRQVPGPSDQRCVLLQPSTPIRPLAAIRQMIAGTDDCATTASAHALRHDQGLAWDFPMRVSVLTGAAYVWTRDRRHGGYGYYGRFPHRWESWPTEWTFNVNTMSDWRMFCQWLRGRR